MPLSHVPSSRFPVLYQPQPGHAVNVLDQMVAAEMGVLPNHFHAGHFRPRINVVTLLGRMVSEGPYRPAISKWVGWRRSICGAGNNLHRFLHKSGPFICFSDTPNSRSRYE